MGAKDLVREANAANEGERNMGLLKALKTYITAMAWSMILSSAIIMEGYDTSVMGNCKYLFHPQCTQLTSYSLGIPTIPGNLWR